MLRTRVRAGPVVGLALSLVFAALMTLVHEADRLVEVWAPSFGEPAPVTLRVPFGPRMHRASGTDEVRIAYRGQRVIVPRGVELDPADPRHVAAVEFELAHRPLEGHRVLAVFVILFTLAMALSAYLRRFGQSRLRLLRVQVGIFVAALGLGLVSKLILALTALPEYWIPIAAVPLWIATIFDRRTAFVVTVMLAFIVASLLKFDLILLCVMLARGMSATLLFLDRKRPRQMAVAGALSGLSSAALLVALAVTFEGYYDPEADLALGGSSALIACVGGGVVSGAIALLLRAPAERMLGHVSRERLIDLTDLEQPLLKKLALEAPGTYEHSRAMANLAEQAASAIGADSLLTRVGAYYHDLGKTVHCKYFVENLAPDEKSPHDDLEPDVSASAIMDHVEAGTEILRRGGIPEPVVEFAYTHHGTQRVEYFWNKCKEQGNPKGIDEDFFRYPGMTPQTKETGILMLVDSIEAASRTIDPPNREQFEAMIQRIIFTKLNQGQLDDCNLELKELRVISSRMAETLVNMHHHRIKYQWQTKQAEEFGVPAEAVRPSPDIQLRYSSIPPGSVAPDSEVAESQGAVEQGAVEQGAVEQGAVEQGAVEQGAVEAVPEPERDADGAKQE